MDDSPLNTSFLAGEKAFTHGGQRYAQIRRVLKERGPSTLFEIAAALQCFDHQISGRITEMVQSGEVIRTNERRTKPETGCQADVLALSLPLPGTPGEGGGEGQGGRAIGPYPPTLILEGEPWDRGPTLGETDACRTTAAPSAAAFTWCTALR